MTTRAAARSSVWSSGGIRSARRRNTPPGRSTQRLFGTALDHLHAARSAGPAGSSTRARSARRDRTRSPCSRRYSCAFSSSRNSGDARRRPSRRSEQDRQVAGDAVLPQLGLAARVGLDRPRATRRRGSPYSSRPASRWKRMRLVDGQPEMPQLDLAVRAGQRQRARDRAAVVILLDQLPRRLFAVGESGREREARGAAGRNAHRLPQADDRIEHRRRWCSTAARVPYSACGRSTRAAAADEARAVGFVLGGAAQPAAAAEHVNQVQRGRCRCAAACAQISASRSGTAIVSTNRLLNAGCARSASAGRQHHLGVAGEVEAARRRGRGWSATRGAARHRLPGRRRPRCGSRCRRRRAATSRDRARTSPRTRPARARSAGRSSTRPRRESRSRT